MVKEKAMGNRNSRKESSPDEDYHRSDAIVMATAMANAAFASSAGTAAHPQQQASAAQRSTPTDEALPPSPLVTPPIRRHDAPSSPGSFPGITSNPAANASTASTKKQGVPHIYHDYSQIPDQADYVRKKTGGVTQPFPEKLHEMLDTEAKNPESQSIVSWLPHGRAFIVRKPKEFTTDVMPKYVR